MPNLVPKYLIAIGASAGGMEEINSFFENTPLDGVAYVKDTLVSKHQIPLGGQRNYRDLLFLIHCQGQ